MKKINIAVLLCALLAISCSDYPKVEKNHFLIEGEISNIADSVEVELILEQGAFKTNRKTEKIIDGKFSFCDTISRDLDFVQIGISYTQEGYAGGELAIAVAPRSYTKITGDGLNYAKWHAEGSLKEQQTINGYYETLSDKIDPYLDVSAELYTTIQQIMKLNDSNDPADKKRIKTLYDEYKKYNEEVVDPKVKEMQIACLDYMSTIPVDEYWLYHFKNRFLLLSKYEKYDYLKPYITKLYECIPEKYFRSGTGAAIYTIINMPKDVEVGDDMVDGELYDLEGNKHLLSEIKSDYILLDFWGLGCGPCMQSIPEMEGIIDFYGDELTVVGICISGDSEDVRQTIADINIGGKQLHERSDPAILFELYGSGGVPQYVLISPERKVVAKWRGYSTGYLNENVSNHLGRRDQLLGIPEGGEVIRLDPNFKIK